MRFIISGKNINVTESLKSVIHDKMGNWNDTLLLKRKSM